MTRSSRAAICSGALFAAACSYSPPEQQVLEKFFRAAKLQDSTTLAGVATVNFDPRSDGSIQEFTIDNIGEPERRAGVDGDVVTEPVTVTAKVVSPAGRTTSRTLVVTLQRAAEKDGDPTTGGTWIVVSIRPSG
jgi:hypothetical protein